MSDDDFTFHRDNASAEEAKPDRPAKVHPVAIVAVALLALGILAWVWLGDWRYAVTVLVATFVCAIVGAALDSRKDRAS